MNEHSIKCSRCGETTTVWTTGQSDRYLSLLRRVVELTRLTVERTPAGYPDVAEFLREEEARKG